jgi:hypothetical protein
MIDTTPHHATPHHATPHHATPHHTRHHTCRFGEGLELEEQQWLVGQINEHIAGLQGVEEVDVSALPPPDTPQVVRDDSNDPFPSP